jgi:hypothetical protein
MNILLEGCISDVEKNLDRNIAEYESILKKYVVNPPEVST